MPAQQNPVPPEKNSTRLIVITGGPGAGKTAVLELAKKLLKENVAILPEAASIIFGGGFWRMSSRSSVIAAQKAIFHTQNQMENLVVEEKRWTAGICDRGTLDGLAYWPETEETFFNFVGRTKEQEYIRYFSVIHLRCPSKELGYNNINPLRIESASEAQEIDERIYRVWSKHPRYFEIKSSANFMDKAVMAISQIIKDLPESC